jgi:hypothetical protein
VSLLGMATSRRPGLFVDGGHVWDNSAVDASNAQGE